MKASYLDNVFYWKNSFSRILLTIGLVTVFFYLGTLPIRFTQINNQNVDLILMITPFILGFIGLYLSMKYIHKANIFELIVRSKFQQFSLKRVLFGFGTWFVIQCILEFVQFNSHPENYKIFISINSNWWVLVFISLIFIPFQTSLEELLLRSYFIQQFYIVYRSPWAGLIISSLLFSLLHFYNPETMAYGQIFMLGYYFIAGFFIGAIALIDKRLELALGFHAANNIFSTTISNYSNSAFKTEALLHVTEINVFESFTYFLVGIFLFFLINATKFKWFADYKLDRT